MSDMAPGSGWDMPIKSASNGDAWGAGDTTNGFATNGTDGFNTGGVANGDGGAAADHGGGGGDDRACFNCGQTG